MNVFANECLHTEYVNDATFFLKDINSKKNILEDLNLFSEFSGFRPNTTKCEIAGVDVLKSVTVVLCRMKYSIFFIERMKILGVYVSYNKKPQEQKKLCDTIMVSIPFGEFAPVTFCGKKQRCSCLVWLILFNGS